MMPAGSWSYDGPGSYTHTSGAVVRLDPPRHGTPAAWRWYRWGQSSERAYPYVDDAQEAALMALPCQRRIPPAPSSPVSQLADQCVARGLSDSAGAAEIHAALGTRTAHAVKSMRRARKRAAL